MNLKVCIVVVMQFSWGSLSLDRKYGVTKISWLSEEDLKLLIKYSFPKSRCCIVHTPKNATESEQTLLKWFSMSYKGYEYFARKSNRVCSDHLLITPNVSEIRNSLKSVPVAEASTRILALIDLALEENSIVLNALMYVNSNVNLVCRNGSYVLSESYLQPRRFRRVKGFQDMRRKSRRIVDFRGRKLQVSTYYSPPFSYLKSTVNTTIDGSPVTVFAPKEKQELDGIELNIFSIIAKALNFTYTIRQPTGRYNHGRKYNDTAWDGGMISQVVNKEVDLAFSNVWVAVDNYQFVKLTQSWTQIFIHLLVPRPKAITSFWALTRPLSPTVWFLIVGLLAFETIYVCVKAKINPRMPRRFGNVVMTLTELLGRMLGTWLPPIAPQVRLQFILWELAGFLIVTIYCSSLAARLANPEFEARIDTVKQFIERNLTWGRENTAPNFVGYLDLSDKYAKKMPNQFILEKSPVDRISRVLQGNHAVSGNIIGGVYYPENEISDEALEVLRVMKEPLGQFYVCFAVQPWLLDPVNAVMTRLKESGIVLYQMVHVIHRRTGAHLREVFVERDRLDFDKFIVLSVNPLGVGFATLIFGLLLASAVFYTEIRAVQGKATLLQTIRNVRKKRELSNK